jgi:hypothetical protein
MISALVEIIIKFVFRCIVEVLCFYTGEIILSMLTAGIKKPRWNYYSDASVTKFYIPTEISVWIGCQP